MSVFVTKGLLYVRRVNDVITDFIYPDENWNRSNRYIHVAQIARIGDGKGTVYFARWTNMSPNLEFISESGNLISMTPATDEEIIELFRVWDPSDSDLSTWLRNLDRNAPDLNEDEITRLRYLAGL